MVTRLPLHLDTLVPSSPPSTSGSSTLIKPWRGLFLVSGTRASDISSNVEVRVTGVETDGDIRYHLWPPRIVFSITFPHALPVLDQLQTYIRNRSPPIPLTTFLPERLRDPDQNVVNQTHFHSLSRLLWDGQLVAVVPINLSSSTAPAPLSHSTTRQGMLIYPVANSTALLLGAIFLTPEETFPEFISSSYSATFENTSSEISSQALASRYNTFFNEDTSSVPISPTVIHSQSRQSSLHRADPRSYGSIRAPSVRISSSYRYSPVPPSGAQGQRTSFPHPERSFFSAGASMGSQGPTTASTSFESGTNSSPSRLSFRHSPIFEFPLIEPTTVPTQPNRASVGQSTSREVPRRVQSERRSPEGIAPSDNAQLIIPQAGPSEQELERESMASSIFNPFDLTTRTRSH
ncbi:hypothetical protein C8R42DRAFT_720903 [Lentinula raphanica]|nr:hypothetical protein C8R42DRAFT_720903 [Lentinula raphanica]